MSLTIKLKQLPTFILGNYGPTKNDFPDVPAATFPGQRKLAPDAADSLLAMYATDFKVRVSDLLRSAESSIAAKRAGRGAQPPGFSGHNFGFSMDLDIEDTMKRYGFTNKTKFDEKMVSFGWYCHRQDGKLDSECWHYNYFGTDAKYVLMCAGHSSTNAGLQQKIEDVYGSYFILNNFQAQQALTQLGFYHGPIDGVIGHQSEAAIEMLQRAYLLSLTNTLTPSTQRVLAFATCTYEVTARNFGS